MSSPRGQDRALLTAAAFFRALGTGLVGVFLGTYLPSIGLEPRACGVVVSTGLAGMATSAVLAMLLADRVGRRRFLIASTAVMVMGGVAGAFATEWIPLLLAVFVAGLPSALAYGPWAIAIGGRDFLSVVDAVTSDVLLPVAGLLTALFVGWIWGVGPALGELPHGAGWFPERLWGVSVRFIIPLTVAAVLIAAVSRMR